MSDIEHTGSLRGRPISQETKLGRKIINSGKRAYIVAAEAGFSARIMTEYCAGRRQMSNDHLLALCRVLKCEPWELTEDDDDDDNSTESQLTDSAHTLPSNGLRTVDDLRRNHPTMQRRDR